MIKQKLNLVDDVYYSRDYVSLFLKNKDEVFDFEYNSGDKFFLNKTIKRPIEKIGNINVEDGYFDLETAYGYGGFYTNSDDTKFIEKALDEYRVKCLEENIIAEFMRFHPFNNFPINFNKYLDFNLNDREIVVVRLENDILSSYTSKVRNTIKRAAEKVTFKESDNYNEFLRLYEITMKKNKADDFYFFDEFFFKKLMALDSVKLYEVIYDNKIISMGFFMFGSDLVHYHLSANTEEAYRLNSNYTLLNNLFGLAKQMNKKYVILGGGTTSMEDDPLLKFKKKFSKNTMPFYISGKIYNKEVYNKYNALWLKQSDKDMNYFLKYRLEVINE
jgi:hypothetical protein